MKSEPFPVAYLSGYPSRERFPRPVTQGMYPAGEANQSSFQLPGRFIRRTGGANDWICPPAISLNSFGWG